MGKPLWVLVSRSWIDYRWLRHADHPWYASARVLFQTTEGDWRGVIDRVTADVLKRTSP